MFGLLAKYVFDSQNTVEIGCPYCVYRVSA